MIDVVSKTEGHSFLAPSGKQGNPSQNFSPKGSFLSVVTAPT
jgi:hypothetical protein